MSQSITCDSVSYDAGATARLKVMHVVLQLDTGGMEKLLVEFARHTDRATTDLCFVSLGTRGRVADELEKLGWPVLSLNTPEGLRPGLVLRLARLFRRENAAVVHAHNTKPLMYAAPAARLAGIRSIVYTRHGQRHQSRKRQDRAFRWAAKLASDVVCVSHDSAAQSASDGLPAKKIRTIWNGIDLARFAYSGPVDRGPAVMVGRLSKEKDIATLVDAVAIVRREEPAFRLEIAGEGACREELAKQVESLGLGGAVSLLGNVSDVPGLLARASMSVLSSVTEGLSLTLLEAAARGLPIVATRVGGNGEVVIQGETGLLVEARDPNALAAAMLEVWRNPQLGRDMGRRGRERVEQHFHARQMVNAYEALYRKQR